MAQKEPDLLATEVRGASVMGKSYTDDDVKELKEALEARQKAIDKKILIRKPDGSYEGAWFSDIKKGDIFCQFPDANASGFARRWDVALEDAAIHEADDIKVWAVKAEKVEEIKCPHCGEDVSSLFKCVCEDCGEIIPRGQGIGWSHEEWPDKSKARGIDIIPLCLGCIAKRMHVD
jgi:hypothetical protein